MLEVHCDYRRGIFRNITAALLCLMPEENQHLKLHRFKKCVVSPLLIFKHHGQGGANFNPHFRYNFTFQERNLRILYSCHLAPVIIEAIYLYILVVFV
ncbi:unnamed protein product, partial [Hymenolepis diminuta]